jgi:hypothetical protein
MWMRMATVADRKTDVTLAAAKVATARFYVTRLLPQTHALAAQIEAGAAPVMALDPATF